MLRFFHALFHDAATAGGYPETLVASAIERAVESTDPWIRAVSGYKKKLRPAVVRAFDYVVALVDGMAPPLPLEPAGYGGDPRLRAFFISSAELRGVLASDRNLTAFRRERGTAPGHALLTMEKQEKTVFGAELSGSIILRDVPQTAVSFVDHHLFDPAENEKKTRRQLKRRAFDLLLGLALKRIALLKAERANLERCHAALRTRLGLQQHWRRGMDGANPTAVLGLGDTQGQLDRIEGQLLALGREDRILEVYLEIVLDVLNRPENHLWTGQETLIVDRMGIKRPEAGGDATAVTLDLLHNSEGRSQVVSLVSLPREG